MEETMSKIEMIKQGLIVLFICLVGAGGTNAQSSEPPQASHRIEQNLVYGMYSGLALLMDVHHPDEPNGYGVIHIAGSGYTAPLSVDAGQLKHQPGHLRHEAWPMIGAGYTVFAINHRSAPRFRYPTQDEDARRAVRFIRSKADLFGIDPDRIGAIGGSSGGHLVSMLALQDGTGDPEDPSPINRLSAKVQCVVARAVRAKRSGNDSQLLLGYRIMPRLGEESEEHRTAREASPYTHVTADDPPMLLLHGDVDPIIPIQGARDLKEALEKVGVPVELIEVKGGGHGAGFRGTDQDVKEIYTRAVHWMDKYLKTEK
jgi:acetyl esterase/lipase